MSKGEEMWEEDYGTQAEGDEDEAVSNSDGELTVTENLDGDGDVDGDMGDQDLTGFTQTEVDVDLAGHTTSKRHSDESMDNREQHGETKDAEEESERKSDIAEEERRPESSVENKAALAGESAHEPCIAPAAALESGPHNQAELVDQRFKSRKIADSSRRDGGGANRQDKLGELRERADIIERSAQDEGGRNTAVSAAVMRRGDMSPTNVEASKSSYPGSPAGACATAGDCDFTESLNLDLPSSASPSFPHENGAVCGGESGKSWEGRECREGRDRASPSAETSKSTRRAVGAVPPGGTAEDRKRPHSPLRRSGMGSGSFLSRAASSVTDASGVHLTSELEARVASTLSADDETSKPDAGRAAVAFDDTESVVAEDPAMSHREETRGLRDESSTATSGRDVIRASQMTSAGFMTSADPSAKPKETVTRPLPSPLRTFPRGSIDDDQGDAAKLAVKKVGVRDEVGVRDGERGPSRLEKNNASPASAVGILSKKTESAVATSGAPTSRRPSPAKDKAGQGDWIQTKSSSSRDGAVAALNGVKNRGRGADDCKRGESGNRVETQDATVSQNILAVGVPHGLRVSDPTRDASDGIGEEVDGSSQLYPDEGTRKDEGDQDVETTDAILSAVNTQDINASNASQIRKKCSQNEKDIERMLLENITTNDFYDGGEASGGSPDEETPSSQLSLDSTRKAKAQDSTAALRDGLSGSRPVRQGSDRGDGGDGGGDGFKGGKRKTVRPASPAAALRHGGNLDRSSARKGAASRTPGACLGASTSKSNAKKRNARR